MYLFNDVFNVKEHMKEKCSPSRTQLHMDDEDTDGLFARLRRQLQAKDDELRLVQKNMAEWKDKTTARLAHKFQLELTNELERSLTHTFIEIRLTDIQHCVAFNDVIKRRHHKKRHSKIKQK